jgi:hypothetical protein
MFEAAHHERNIRIYVTLQESAYLSFLLFRVPTA